MEASVIAVVSIKLNISHIFSFDPYVETIPVLSGLGQVKTHVFWKYATEHNPFNKQVKPPRPEYDPFIKWLKQQGMFNPFNKWVLHELTHLSKNLTW